MDGVLVGVGSFWSGEYEHFGHFGHFGVLFHHVRGHHVNYKSPPG
jgi:hypothetical protein